jgi:ferrochelatase
MALQPYDAVLVLSFGGPEGPDDVMPFLENVTRGRDVPRERLEVVAQQYLRFGGRSPINEQARALAAAVQADLGATGHDLPVYLGNRNWHPLLADTLRRMAADGVRHAVAFATAAWSSYSSCRQYLEDIERARAEVGPSAPLVDKLRPFADHAGFIEAQADRVRDALAAIATPDELVRGSMQLVFTAHSIPRSMARGCDYEAQLHEASRLVAERAAGGLPWQVAYQSRSGPPQVPWLEPDVGDVLERLAGEGVRQVLVVPIGFVSDHMEVRYDLDVLAAERAAAVGIQLHRAPTVGTHPRFVAMVRELIEERVSGAPVPSVGSLGPRPASCPPDCCQAPRRP